MALQKLVGGVAAVARTLFVAFGEYHVPGLVEVENCLAPDDRPAPVAPHPTVKIAAIDPDLNELAVLHDPGCRMEVGLAAGTVAVQRDDRIADLVRMIDGMEMRGADEIDHSAAT